MKKLFIVTSRKKEEVETLLNGNLSAILPYFNSVITSDMVKNHKPSPDSLLKMIDCQRRILTLSAQTTKAQ